MIERTSGFGYGLRGAGLLQAHHSLAGMYDMNGKNTPGTVTIVKFTDPHGSLAVAVKNQDGRVIRISAGNPNE